MAKCTSFIYFFSAQQSFYGKLLKLPASIADCSHMTMSVWQYIVNRRFIQRINVEDQRHGAVSKKSVAAAVNWQNFCLLLPFGDAAENIDKRTEEEGSLCKNDDHQTRIRCSCSEFKACSSFFPRNHNAVITIDNT